MSRFARILTTLVPALCLALGLLARPGLTAAQERVFLWTASSTSATAHILGSIHLAREDLYPLDPRIEQAFLGSDVLVVELDATRLDQDQADRKSVV